MSSYRSVLALARSANVDLVLHTGDLFDHPRPSAGMMTAAAEPLLALAVDGIPVVIVPGNHEHSAIPSSLLLMHPNIHIVTEPTTLLFSLRGQRVALSGFPCLRKHVMEQFDAAVQATNWADVNADVRILALHQAVDSATCGPANYRFRAGRDAIDRQAIPRTFDLVACGHVHRHQALDADGIPVVYCGSVDRITFAEATEPKGAVILEPCDNRMAWSFHTHTVRPMSMWPLDVTDLSRNELVERLSMILDDIPDLGIAQIRLSGTGPADILTGLRFEQLARDRRPDALITLTSRDVYRERPGATRGSPSGSPFAALQGPSVPDLSCTMATVCDLPPTCGVYCLLDEHERLLYVGKSGNIRTRVATHRRGTSDTGFFSGWTRRIVTCTARTAASELEALLIEAELIRVHRPAFNRQMRRWPRYCYLVEDSQTHGQLEVRDTPAGPSTFGPYRSRRAAREVAETLAALLGVAHCPEDETRTTMTLSLFHDAECATLCRRYFDHQCSGPCGGRIAPTAYARLLEGRRRILRGIDDTLITTLERQIDDTPAPASATRCIRARSVARGRRTSQRRHHHHARPRQHAYRGHPRSTRPASDGPSPTSRSRLGNPHASTTQRRAAAPLRPSAEYRPRLPADRRPPPGTRRVAVSPPPGGHAADDDPGGFAREGL